MGDKQVLVVIETQRVKGYLFASPILRETRGASLLLDQLNRTETKRLLENYKGCSEKIYLGDGSGRILFESKDKAEEFAGRVRKLYREKTGNARVSVEVVKRDKKKNGQDKSFPEWIARAVPSRRRTNWGGLKRFRRLLAGGFVPVALVARKQPTRSHPISRGNTISVALVYTSDRRYRISIMVSGGTGISVSPCLAWSSLRKNGRISS